MKISLRINRLDDFKRIILKGFVFLGPMGNLLVPQVFSHAFRAYYFILILFPLFFISCWQRMWKICLCFIPFFIYSFVFIDVSSCNDAYQRLLLFLSQFMFVLGAGFYLNSEQEKIELIFLYLKSFYISLLVGYVFFIGFYSSLISYNWIEHFSVLAQTGYGLLRFGPGSYPNEYGIVTSFVLSVLTWMLCTPNFETPFSRKFIQIFYVLALVALLLTTTRAAYLSYLFALFYIAVKSRKFIRVLVISLLTLTGVVLILGLAGVNMWNVLSVGFHINNLEQGSLSERLIIWRQAQDLFVEQPWTGNGFFSWGPAHNVYLQLLVELGLLGVCLLIGGVFLAILTKKYWIFRRRSMIWHEIFHQNIVKIGLMHVLWFAMSNHNLNHHMTWFVLLLCFKKDSQRQIT